MDSISPHTKIAGGEDCTGGYRAFRRARVLCFVYSKCVRVVCGVCACCFLSPALSGSGSTVCRERLSLVHVGWWSSWLVGCPGLCDGAIFLFVSYAHEHRRKIDAACTNTRNA